jgi:hypothetical protein
MIVVVAASAQNLEIPGAVEMPAPQETLVVELEFKNINVFEYDLDLIFMDEDSTEVWFNEISGDISEAELYAVEDNEGFPEYTVNEEAIGKKYTIMYIEIPIEGEFSGEEAPPKAKDILNVEEVSQN